MRLKKVLGLSMLVAGMALATACGKKEDENIEKPNNDVILPENNGENNGGTIEDNNQGGSTGNQGGETGGTTGGENGGSTEGSTGNENSGSTGGSTGGTGQMPQQPEVVKPVVSEGEINVLKASGDFEVAYAEFEKVAGADSYNVYVKEKSLADSAFKKIDDMLVREYLREGKSYMRCDAVGLKAGDYEMKIVAVQNGAETKTQTIVKELNVLAHERTGFGFVNGTSSGAYNEDGTLKSNAIVLYITEANKDSISLEVTGATTNPCVGLQNILNGFKKGKDSRSLCVRFIGNITDHAVMDKGDIVVDGCKNGITLEGIGDDAVFNGWGLRIKNSSNVEVRNVATMNCNSSEGDNIGLQQGNDHIWVHNNDFFYGDAGSDADQAKGDGALDTKTSTYVTHSYNHFFDSGKSNLQGMKSESTSNYITYHHNWYDHSDSRHPRVRTCTVHAYNNYFDGNAKYSIGVTMGASLFSEANYFRSTAQMKPYLSSNQGTDALGEGTFSGENGGIIKAYGDIIDGPASIITAQDNQTSFDVYMAQTKTEQVPSTYVTVAGGTTYNNFDTDSKLMYTYTAQSAEDARNTVIKYAGRIGGGDFKYTFTTGDDSSYAVDTQLKAKLTNYKTSLVSVNGTAISSGTQAGESGPAGSVTPENQGGSTGTTGGTTTPSVVIVDDSAWTELVKYDFETTQTITQTAVTNGLYYQYSTGGTDTGNNVAVSNGTLKINDTTAATTTGYIMFDEINSGKLSITMDLIGLKQAGKWTPVEFIGDSQNLKIRTDVNKLMGYNFSDSTDANVITDGAAYSANVSLKLVMDFDTKTLQIAINGRVIDVKGNTFTSLKGIKLMTAGSDTTRSFSVDNVVIKTN